MRSGEQDPSPPPRPVPTISEQKTTSSRFSFVLVREEVLWWFLKGMRLAPDLESEAFFVFEVWRSSLSSLDVQ
jgi:hypothetical protein